MMTGLLTRIFSRRGTATYDAPVDQSQAAADESATAAKLHSDEIAKKSLAEQMRIILDRPEPRTFECGCCGSTNELEFAERVDSRCIFTDNDLRRFRCSTCKAVFGPVQLIQCSPAELGRLYECLYSFYSEGATQRFQEKTFYLMNPSTRGEYLNYACGDWVVGVDRLRAIGWHIWGFEPFQRVNSDAILSDYGSLRPNAYAGLMSSNYLEHVQFPAAYFNECSRLIAPRGKMAHSTPCYDYMYEFSAFHLYFYCGESVQMLAARTGFRILSEHRTDKQFKDASYACFVFEKLE